jgi:radical SAM protein with 4Fe4S-binding SPASM domain
VTSARVGTAQRARRRLTVIRGLARTWTGRPATPTRLVVDVTRRCNLRCHMCRTWQQSAATEMTPAQYAALFAELDGLVWLDITGGEPFLRRDIAAVFEAAVEHSPVLGMLHFQTNGWATSRIVETTRRLRALGRQFDLVVTVSIDGPAKVHDAIRGREGSFERALATARVLAEIADVEVHVGTTVLRDNVGELEALRRQLFAELPGFSDRRWHLNEVSRSRHFFANERVAGLEAPSDDRLGRHVRRRGMPTTMVELMEAVYLLHLRRYQQTGRRAVPCQALRSTAFIAPEGDVFPCHLYDRPLGNLGTRTLREIWASPETRRARDDVERLACGGCFSACEAYPSLAGAPLRAVAGAAASLASMATAT